MNPINVYELEARQLIATSTGEILSAVRSLTEAFSLNEMLVHHETLLPGKRAAPAHYHTEKEELIIVLERNPSVWVDGKMSQLKPGDAIGFAPNTNVAHTIINQTDSPAVILTIGTNPTNDEVILTGFNGANHNER